MKILWASPNTILDTSNGAAITIREYFNQLAARDWEIQILSATVFVNRHGMSGRNELWRKAFSQKGKFIEVQDGKLKHKLLVTQQTRRALLYSYELESWFNEFRSMLRKEKPDLVLFFDKSLITSMTAREAKAAGVKVGVILNHGNNSGLDWCRDVDFMLTDTQATAEMYRVREGYSMIPVGKFIESRSFVAESHTRERLLFVNPIPAKGGILVIQLAFWLAKFRPEITLQVVDTRGTWRDLLSKVSRELSEDPALLSNVVVTPNTSDMKTVYSKARVLLAPSLWWESGGRVLVEAIANGVPVVASKVGGTPEVLGDAGRLIEIPKEYTVPPHDTLASPELLDRFTKAVSEYWEDEQLYQAHSQLAKQEFERLHSIARNGDNLSEVLSSIILGDVPENQ